MSLLRSTGIIGGLTLVSRLAGFARDMILARVLGAGLAADAFLLAFQLPNIFRRLFAEGAFSAAFVPLFSRRLHGEDGRASAEAFCRDVLSVFVPILIGFAALFELVMPAIVWVMASGFAEVPGKFELAVALSRITFPYIVLISLVSLLTGILNSLSRFAPGAAFPILLNIALIAALLAGDRLRAAGGDDETVAFALAWGVAAGGIVQLLWMWFWVRRAGIRLPLHRPRLTPEVKELGLIILPAVFGAGVYQINQLVQLYFVTSLPEGSLAYLAYADRLNQLPLGVIGIALGTAILPGLSRFVGGGDRAGADRLQSSAIELAMLLTLPAAAALAVCAGPFVTAFFQGGRFDAADSAITASVIVALVAGLPAYVMIKVLTPAFFARKDTRTPVVGALVGLIFFAGFNILFVDRYGIVGLAASSAIGAWLNTLFLYIVLVRRGLYRMDSTLVGQLLRQALAAGAMVAVLLLLRPALQGWYGGSIVERAASVAALVLAGAVAYFGVAALDGAVDRTRLQLLMKRKT
ncbi:murein biosynthesis integral membrane protein MurJ [Sphingosinicella terrae]|uniref:murein biosynthesis integral membrane protein MurJ n=1 Tax=Sphingosinicella terrae TaxID=2172047 RepID=UPI000E0CDBD5|nr:murein biosynthesis integral membrane protein MurJ [Sphingosinicella terrae]